MNETDVTRNEAIVLKSKSFNIEPLAHTHGKPINQNILDYEEIHTILVKTIQNLRKDHEEIYELETRDIGHNSFFASILRGAKSR